MRRPDAVAQAHGWKFAGPITDLSRCRGTCTCGHWEMPVPAVGSFGRMTNKARIAQVKMGHAAHVRGVRRAQGAARDAVAGADNPAITGATTMTTDTLLTFAEFQATRTESYDLAADTGDDSIEYVARGFTYMDGAAHVERDAASADRYTLTISSESRSSADLWDLERRLYRWYCAEHGRAAQAVFVDDPPATAGLHAEQERRRGVLRDRLAAAQATLHADGAAQLVARYAAIWDGEGDEPGGPAVHAAMAAGAVAAEFDANTGGWVWVSHSLHEFRAAPAHVRLLAMAGCDTVSVYAVPADCRDVRQFVDFVWHLCGDDAAYLIVQSD